MIRPTYSLVENLVWFAMWNCDYWHYDLQPEDEKRR